MSILAIILSICLLGCSTTIDVPKQIEPVKSEPEIVETEKTKVEVSETMNIGFDKFDSDLINYIENSEDYKTENFVVSPVSIKLALGLTIEGAEDETKTEMLKALGIESEEELRNLAKEMSDISSDVEERVASEIEYFKEYYEEDAINKSKFIVTNSIWKNKDRGGKISEDYQEIVLNHYNAKAEEITSLQMKETINDYVKKNTNNLIKEIVDDEVKNANTVLVNTVYLNDSWSEGLFEEYNTKEKDFITIDKSKVKKDFMTTQDDFLYYEDKETKLLLTLTKNDFGVLYVLGDNSNILEKMNKMESCEVIVEVPKMDIESTFDNKYLVGFMNSLGVKKAFDPMDANFGNMFDGLTSDFNIYIEDIIHKTKLTTDEKGIEAAAATAVIMYDGVTALPPIKPEPKKFIANEPFSFYVFNMNQWANNVDINRNTDYSFDNTKLLFYGNYVK